MGILNNNANGLSDIDVYNSVISGPTPIGPLTVSNGTSGTIGNFGPTWHIDDALAQIRGQMVKVTYEVSDLEASLLTMSAKDFMDEVKFRLAELMVKELLQNKLIEFTSENIPNDQKTVFRARLFATPDEQVRILRKNNK